MLDFCKTININYIFLLYIRKPNKSKRFFILLKMKKCYKSLAKKNNLHEICIGNNDYKIYSSE